MKQFLLLNLLCLVSFSLSAQLDNGYQIGDSDKNYGQLTLVHSQAMNRDLPVLVFLPDNYKAGIDSFPVVYLLHGVNRRPLTEEGLRKLYNPKLELIKLATYHQLIIVTPIVGNSFYLNSSLKPENQFATYIGEEVPVHIDQHFRTIPDRSQRFLCGFSMGGYGAVSLLCRYPDNFSVACSRGGVMNLATGVEDLYWDEIGHGVQALIGDYWSDPQSYHQNSCFNLVNHIRQRDDVAIVLEVGTDDFLYRTNQKFRQHLQFINFKHIYAEYPGGHYLDSHCLNSLFAHLAYFRQ